MASSSLPMPPPPPHHISPGMEENGPGPFQPNPSSHCLVVFFNVISTVTHLVLGAVAFSAFSYANIFGGQDHITQHIHLCVFGYVILSSQAIMAFNPHSGFVHNLKYPQKKAIHWVLQVIGSAFAIVGSIIALNGVRNPLSSTHGIVGLTAMILTSISLISGVLRLICNKRLSAPVPNAIHACLGALTISFAYITLCIAFNDYYRDDMGDINASLSISLAVFGLLGILLMVLMNAFSQRGSK